MKYNNIELLSILTNYKWINVEKYNEPDNINDQSNEFIKLNDHHIKETTFLIDKCKELAITLLDNKEIDNLNLSFSDADKIAKHMYLTVLKQNEETLAISKIHLCTSPKYITIPCDNDIYWSSDKVVGNILAVERKYPNYEYVDTITNGNGQFRPFYIFKLKQ